MLVAISISVAVTAVVAYFYARRVKVEEVEKSSLTLRAITTTTRAKADVSLASAVVVKFSSVELKPVDGDVVKVSFAEPKTINFLALDANVKNALLDDQVVPAGKYEWIRLKALTARGSLESYVQLPDGQHPLWIPSGNTSGLKLTQGFVMPETGAAEFAIDFDLSSSLKGPTGADADWTMRPTLKLVDNYIAPAPVVEAPVVEPVVVVEAPKTMKKAVAKKKVANKRGRPAKKTKK